MWCRYREEPDMALDSRAYRQQYPRAGWYAPSVTTGYAPSTRYRTGRTAHKGTAAYADYRYPVGWRYAIKVVQMVSALWWGA